MKVLLADGDLGFLRLVSTALEAHGHEVIATRTGHEARAAVVLRKPDLIIIAGMLPDGDGQRWVARLREHSGPVRGTPVLMVSSFWMCGTERDQVVRELGLLDLLIKPIDPVELAGIVDRSLTVVSARLLGEESARIRRAYLDSLPGRLGGLQKALERARAEPVRPGALLEVMAITGALHATAELNGLEALADVAGRLHNLAQMLDLSALPQERRMLWQKSRDLHREAWRHADMARSTACMPVASDGHSTEGDAPGPAPFADEFVLSRLGSARAYVSAPGTTLIGLPASSAQTVRMWC